MRPPRNVVSISLNYNKINPFHKDLTLNVNDYIRETQDTYFLAVDYHIMPNEESWEKVKLVLCHLINAWINIIINTPEDSSVYLPFDFSDQYIGCIKVEICGNDVAITYGFTYAFDGTTLCPSQAVMFIIDSDEFVQSKLYPNGIILDKVSLIDSLKSQISNLI